MKTAAVIASLALMPASALVAPAAPVRPSTALAARQPITGGNWKMNPTSLEAARELAKSVAAAAGSSAAEGIVFPPYPFIGPVGEIIKDTKLNLGSQSIFFEDKGAYTGAVSASMVKSLGVKYVLAGHSERRTVFKDDDEAINKKVLKVIEDGMRPVLCIGETEEEYDAGLCADVCKLQLAKDLAGVSAAAMKDVVIAYEPVWAIGTGKTATPEQAQEVHASIRAWLATNVSPAIAKATRIQYGGSMKGANAAGLLSKPDIDGGLIGGASLKAEFISGIAAVAPKP